MAVQKIKLFPNYNSKSLDLANELTIKLLTAGYSLVDKDYDLAIAIGGDGSYLRMVKNNQFNSEIYYLGVNTGTLGFLQEVKPDELDLFVEKLQSEAYRIETIGIQETKIKTLEKEDMFYSLNELAIRNSNFKIANLDVFVNNELLLS